MTTHPPLTRRRLLATATGAASVGLAGCVGGLLTDDGGSGELGDPGHSVEVEVMTIPRPQLDPGIVHVEVGGTVEWVGRGQRNSLVSYHPDTYGERRIPEDDEPFKSGYLRDGDRFERTFGVEGIHDYVDPTVFCSTHEAVGVVGRVVVGWPELEDEPAMQVDPEELPSRAATVTEQFNEQCRDVLTNP